MLHKELLIAFLLFVTTLVGCSGDEGDDVTIIVPPPEGGDGNGDGGGDGGGNGDGDGDCDTVVEAEFVEFNDDCSVGTISGDVLEDYTLTSGVDWRLSGDVIVGNGAATGQSRIALDVGEDAWHFVNPDLPNTRSEMGLPLKVRPGR